MTTHFSSKTKTRINPRGRAARAAALALTVAAGAAALVAPATVLAERAAGQDQDRGGNEKREDRGDRPGERRERERERDGDRDGRGRRDDWGGGGPFGGWGPNRGDMRDFRSVPAPWHEVAAFMSRVSPFLIGEVQRMAEGEGKERIKRGLTYRYRGLRWLENRDPEGYEQRLAQLAVEDQVFRLMSQWGAADEARRETIREELSTQVARLVDLDLQDRRRRLQRMEEELKEQRQDLDQDGKDRDKTIERRVGRFLDWGNKWPPGRDKGKGKDEAKGDTKGDGGSGGGNRSHDDRRGDND